MASVLEQLLAELQVANRAAGLDPGAGGSGLALGMKHDASGTPTTNYWYGPGSIFGVGAVLDEELFSTKIQPRGLASMLPARGVTHVQTILPYYTGQLASGGTDATGPCTTCREAGPQKSCFLQPVMGRLCVDSEELDITRAGTMLHKYDGLLRLQNPPLLSGDFTTPPLAAARGGGANPLTNELAGKLLGVGSEFQLWLNRLVYTSNPVNNVGTGTLFFNGLGLQITTGITDAQTGVACPAMDSVIQDFDYNEVCADTAGYDIVEWIVWMYEKLQMDGLNMNMQGVEHAIAMRPSLFNVLVKCWPCRYMTYRCQPWQPPGGFGSQQQPVNLGQVSAAEAIDMRDRMATGSYLLIKGIPVPVIQDTGILEYNGVVGHTYYDANLNPGQFASDIWFIPMRWRGMALTEWWFLNFAETDEGWELPDGLRPIFYTDGGRFIWTAQQTAYCVYFKSTIRPALILRTPYLAGRIEDVMYIPHKHEREPHPDEYYHRDGGQYPPRDYPW